MTWTVVLTGIGVVVAIVIAIVRAAWILMMKIGDLAADVKADHAKIGAVAADVKANHAKIGDLAADVKANHAKIGDLAADVKETRVMIGALTADVRADHAMIDALGKKIDKNHGEIRVDLANLRHGADIADAPFLGRRNRWPALDTLPGAAPTGTPRCARTLIAWPCWALPA